MNYFMFCGRINEIKKEKENTIVKIKMQRYFKNENGQYENDIIPVYLKGNIADATNQYCKIDDLISIKGNVQNDDGTIKFVAEKASFLQQNGGK